MLTETALDIALPARRQARPLLVGPRAAPPDIVREGQRSLAWLDGFIAAEGIACDFGVVGRFHAAHDAAQFEQLARSAAQQPQGLEAKLHVVPPLRELRISHSWCGFTAYTFDKLMHIGRHERLHYAMGCCGSGVGMSSYPGMRLGQQVLGLAEGRTAFDGLRLQKRPLYRGKPWFLAPSKRHNR